MQDPTLQSLVSDTTIFLEQLQLALLPPHGICVPGRDQPGLLHSQKHPVVTEGEYCA